MREERGAPSADMEAWRKAVGAKGWGTPTWPADSTRPRVQRMRSSTIPSPHALTLSVTVPRTRITRRPPIIEIAAASFSSN